MDVSGDGFEEAMGCLMFLGIAVGVTLVTGMCVFMAYNLI